jgi:hypothetical protein
MYSATATAAKLPSAPAHAVEASHQLVNAERARLRLRLAAWGAVMAGDGLPAAA